MRQDRFRIASLVVKFRKNALRTHECARQVSASNLVLNSVRWKFAIVYLEYIIIFSKTNDDHMSHLNALLPLLKDRALTLKLRMCLFLQYLVEYLGHIVTLASLHVGSKTYRAVQ